MRLSCLTAMMLPPSLLAAHRTLPGDTLNMMAAILVLIPFLSW
jgi:hypothetical protein